jgi:hypothetical protein
MARLPFFHPGIFRRISREHCRPVHSPLFGQNRSDLKKSFEQPMRMIIIQIDVFLIFPWVNPRLCRGDS